ncbi:MAG: flagellar biosynthesis repressor FlbT [Alphaproteobacteria bacterium]
MPLKLSLAHGERFVVNGAVMRNDGADASFVFENQAHILRQKDILTSAEACTPGSRVYLALQCAYMFPDRRARHIADFGRLIADFVAAAPSATAIADRIVTLVAEDKLYGAIKECRNLVEYEAEILSHVQ